MTHCAECRFWSAGKASAYQICALHSGESDSMSLLAIVDDYGSGGVFRTRGTFGCVDGKPKEQTPHDCKE